MSTISPSTAQKWVDSSTTFFWFRRDLRLEDNAGFYHALKEQENVLPLFIFDRDILDRLDDPSDARVTFIYDCLVKLQAELQALGSTLLVFYGRPVEIFNELQPRAVYTNHDYEPYGKSRDENVRKLLGAKGVHFHSFKDIVIFEKDEVLKPDGTPYTIFTPYSRKWKETFTASSVQSFPTKTLFNRLKRCSPAPLPTLEGIGFIRSQVAFPERKVPVSIIAQYAEQRDLPAIPSTTRLGIHLRFGTVSIRKLVSLAYEKSEVWLNELIWREFYHMILWHFPHAVTGAFKPAYDRIAWKNDPEEFRRWCEGNTGYPIVDAGMRELNTTGFMHNRVRMIVASFLTKHLLIDWRWGEAYFAKKLLDFDLAANNGGWQWAAGSGCDAAPYFRVFNPYLQAAKFDPDGAYVRRWVPELGTPAYPPPIVDHAFARERVMKYYQEALG